MTAVHGATQTGGGTAGTGDRTLTVNPTIGDLLIIWCNVSVNTNATPTCTDDSPDGFGQYDLITVATWASSANTLSAFIRRKHIGDATAITVTVATGSNTAGELGCERVAHAPYAGISAIRQFAVQSNGTTGTTAGPVFGSACLTTNFTMAVQGGDDTTSTTPASWTEQADASQATPTTALQICTRNSGFTGTTVTWGASTTGNYAAIIIELKSTGPVSPGTGTTANDTASSTTHVITRVPAVGDYWIVACHAAVNTNATPTCTDDNGGTYTLIDTIGVNADANTTSVFVRDQLHVNTTSTNITITTGANDSCVFGVGSFTGMARAGIASIVQSAKNKATASSSPNITWTNRPRAQNPVVVVCGTLTALFNAISVPLNQWTEFWDATVSTPTASLVMTQVPSTGGAPLNGVPTDKLLDWTSTTKSNWGMIAIELDASTLLDPTGVATGAAFGTGVLTLEAEPTGLTSSEAHGSTTVLASAFVDPTGVATAGAFGTDNITHTLAPTGLAPSEQHGTQNIVAVIAPTGLTTSEVHGSTAVVEVLAPTGIGSSEAHGSTTITPNWFIDPAGVASSSAFGTQVLVLTVDPSGVATVGAIGAAAVLANWLIDPTAIASSGAIGAQNVVLVIAPSGVVTAEAIGIAVLGSFVDVAGVASSGALGAQNVVLVVAPSGIASSGAIGTADVFIAFRIDPTGVPSSEAIGAAVIALVVASTAVGSAEAIGAAAVLANWFIDPNGLATGAAFGTATLVVFVDVAGVGSSEQLGAATLLANWFVDPAGVPSSAAFGTQVLVQVLAPTGLPTSEQHGTQNVILEIAVSGVASSEAVSAPVVVYVIAPAAIATSGAFGTAVVNLAILAAAIASAESVGAAAVEHQVLFIDATGLVSGEQLGVPALARILDALGVPSGEVVPSPFLLKELNQIFGTIIGEAVETTVAITVVAGRVTVTVSKEPSSKITAEGLPRTTITEDP